MRSQKIITYGKPLEYVEEVNPIPTGTEVLVSIGHCGVCHSDLHLQDGFFSLGNDRKLDVSNRRELPFTLGHEIQGRIAALGPEVSGIEVGDKYVVYPWIGCRDCIQCERGLENLCARNRSLGTAKDGGFSDYVLVPHPRYLLNSSGIDDGLAGTFMCSGLTAYSALQKVGELPQGDCLLVIGLGGVGFMALQLARLLFGESVLSADIDETKRATAIEAGAKEVYDPSEKGVVDRIVSESQGRVYAVVDFVGSEDSVNFGRQCLGRGGRLVLVGLFGGAIQIDLPLFTLQGHSIVGSITGSLEEAKEVLKLAKSGKLDPIPIEKRFINKANEALDDLRAGRIFGRVVLTP